MKYKDHYEYLDANLKTFFDRIGVLPFWGSHRGLIVAHGDKCEGYRFTWERIGLHFYHGAAIYLLTYVKPFCDDVRETKKGWVDVSKWIQENKDKFLPFLPSVE